MFEWWILALISALFSGGAAIIEKKVLFKEKALGFTTLLAFFNLILCIPFFFFIDFANLPLNGLLVLFIKSLLGATAFLCVMQGIKDLELSSALPLLVLTPGLVAFFAFVFLGEALKEIEIIGMIFLLTGTYVLQLKKKQKILDPFRAFLKSNGYYYIIGALVLFTITSVLDKALLSNFKVPLNTFMGFQHLFFALIFFVLLLAFKKENDFKHTVKNSWKWLVLLSGVTIVYRYTQILAVKVSPVALVLSLKRISVFFAVLIGGRIFKESNLLKKAIATALMVLGAVLVING